MRPIVIILVTALVFVGAIGVTYWQTSEMKDREFAARLAQAPHKRDTVTAVTSTPQPFREATLRDLRRMDTPDSADFMDAGFDTTLVGWTSQNRAALERVSAPFDTTVIFDTVATVRLQYDPLKRMATVGLQLSPVKQIERTITDSVFVPVPEHDSFLTRAAIFTAGAGAAAVLLTIIH